VDKAEKFEEEFGNEILKVQKKGKKKNGVPYKVKPEPYFELRKENEPETLV
jgi:hypothetical protein